MKSLVASEADGRKPILKSMLTSAYPFIFRDGFDLSTATSSQLREEFEQKTAASGATVKRCMNFLRDAAVDAGIPVSPYIKERKARNNSSPRQKRQGQPRRIEASPDVSPPAESHQHQAPKLIEAQSSLLLWGLFQRLPKPGGVWPKTLRDQWLQTLQNVFTLEYRDE